MLGLKIYRSLLISQSCTAAVTTATATPSGFSFAWVEQPLDNHTATLLFWWPSPFCSVLSPFISSTSIWRPPPPAPAPTPESSATLNSNCSCANNLGTSSTASTPTQSPVLPDPMDCLPLHQDTKSALKNLMAARYSDHGGAIRRKYFDVYNTQEERLAPPPSLCWPIDQWTRAVELWGTEDNANKRKQSSINRGKMVMKHTCGSESIPKKRVKMMRETGKAVDGVDLFIETHKSKKTDTFIDEELWVTAERLKEVVSQNMNENGSCNLSEQEVFGEVFGPEKKGREWMKGKHAGKKGKKTVMEVDVVEAVRRENIENIETLRRENIANIQAAIAAMNASGQLMVPPIGPRQDSGATQDEVNEKANTQDK